MKNHKPDIVLMDVQMPELDGLEATRQIRKLKNGLAVPIIALTAGVSKEERELCFKSGMDDFLSKPIERNELKRITQKYLLREVKTSEVEVIFNTDSIHFDRNKLLSKIGNEEVLQSLLLLSKTEYPKYVLEITKAIQAGDELDIKQKAHKLKGSALNMEFVAMGDIAKQIEVSASNAAELSGLLKMLENEWEMLLNELK
jgi:response regulator RpfG family c-di-GMP phosphodiesterase